MQALARAMAEAECQVANILQQLAGAVSGPVALIYDAIRQAYIDDGACYGPNHEGLMRWVLERRKADELVAEAEAILEHQRTVADLRRALGEQEARA